MQQKIESLIRGFNSSVIQIPVFKIRDLKKVWATAYPTSIKIDDFSYVAEDRNHRLLALSIGIQRGLKFNNLPVELFLGQENHII